MVVWSPTRKPCWTLGDGDCALDLARQFSAQVDDLADVMIGVSRAVQTIANRFFDVTPPPNTPWSNPQRIVCERFPRPYRWPDRNF